MRASDLSTPELERAARALLRAYVNVAAARRAPEALRRWLASHADVAPPAANPHWLAHSDIGPVTVLRYSSDRVYAAAAVRRRDGAKPGLVAAELSTQTGVLRATRLAHVASGREVDQRSRWALEPEPPEHLRGLLGALPSGQEARLRWATAAAVIADYRDTHGIEDTASALGPVPDDPEQRRERQRALAYTRQLVSEIDVVEPDRGRAGRQLPGPGLTR